MELTRLQITNGGLKQVKVTLVLITAHKRSCEKIVFRSICLSTGGGGSLQEVSVGGVLYLGVSVGGRVSVTGTPGLVEEQVVCILLECILVFISIDRCISLTCSLCGPRLHQPYFLRTQLQCIYAKLCSSFAHCSQWNWCRTSPVSHKYRN